MSMALVVRFEFYFSISVSFLFNTMLNNIPFILVRQRGPLPVFCVRVQSAARAQDAYAASRFTSKEYNLIR